MPIHSEKAILYAYRHKASGEIVTALYSAKAPATVALRSSLEYPLGSIFWKHNFEVVEFDIVERRK